MALVTSNSFRTRGTPKVMDDRSTRSERSYRSNRSTLSTASSRSRIVKILKGNVEIFKEIVVAVAGSSAESTGFDADDDISLTSSIGSVNTANIERRRKRRAFRQRVRSFIKRLFLSKEKPKQEQQQQQKQQQQQQKQQERNHAVQNQIRNNEEPSNIDAPSPVPWLTRQGSDRSDSQAPVPWLQALQPLHHSRELDDSSLHSNSSRPDPPNRFRERSQQHQPQQHRRRGQDVVRPDPPQFHQQEKAYAQQPEKHQVEPFRQPRCQQSGRAQRPDAP